MIKFLLIVAILLSIGCAPVPHKRDSSYYAASALVVADGLSTSYALKAPNTRETGWWATRIIGRHPTDPQIAGYTALGLGVLEWSRYWNPLLGKTYRWSIVITRPRTIMLNYRIGNG